MEAVEERIYDKSRGNIFVNTLNVVKSACLLIELLQLVRNSFGFMQRRVQEIRQQIIKITIEFMSEVSSEDEMRFLLLEKDLDNRDALNLIYDYRLIELLENPFA